MRVRARSRPRRPDRGDGGATPAWQAPAAGVASGALSTSTSLSGPPLVFYLLAREAAPAAMRDTLAAIFVVQAVLGFPALLLTGTFELPAGLWALLAAGLAGQLLGRRAFAWLRGERYERAVLTLLALTALVALAASIVCTRLLRERRAPRGDPAGHRGQRARVEVMAAFVLVVVHGEPRRLQARAGVAGELDRDDRIARAVRDEDRQPRARGRARPPSRRPSG